jgi:hypothetical protein
MFANCVFSLIVNFYKFDPPPIVAFIIFASAVVVIGFEVLPHVLELIIILTVGDPILIISALMDVIVYIDKLVIVTVPLFAIINLC